MAGPEVEASVDEGEAPVGALGEGIDLPPSPHVGSEWRMDAPVEAPLRTYERRDRGPESGREEEDARVRIALTEAEGALRDAQVRLDRVTRDNEVLEIMMRATPPPGGVGPNGAPVARPSAPGKAIQPREYSPRGNVGPAKWIFHMGMYFEYAHVTGDDRVHHGAILLRDAAEAWWRSHVLATTDERGDATIERIITWEEFRQRLVEVFTPVSEKEQARYKLYGLQQTTSVQAYTMAFRELTFAIDDLSAAEAKTLYEKGLKRDIWKDVRLRFPTTLDEVITLAEQIDAVAGGNTAQIRPGVRTAQPATVTANRRFFARRGGGANRPQGARLNGMAGPNVLGADPTALPPPQRLLPLAAVRPPPRRGPAVQRHGAAVQRLPPVQGGGRDRDRLRREGRCFLCAQLGHLARDCPNPGNGPRRQG